ncbi:hypothetical protein H9P43_006292 [Blastocladiella emersonii ATCC 22665]|nr:hypothetical protein H9P43_006292 [Blastocladiella emersonii ATCC 22665]
MSFPTAPSFPGSRAVSDATVRKRLLGVMRTFTSRGHTVLQDDPYETELDELLAALVSEGIVGTRDETSPVISAATHQTGKAAAKLAATAMAPAAAAVPVDLASWLGPVPVNVEVFKFDEKMHAQILDQANESLGDILIKLDGLPTEAAAATATASPNARANAAIAAATAAASALVTVSTIASATTAAAAAAAKAVRRASDELYLAQQVLIRSIAHISKFQSLVPPAPSVPTKKAPAATHKPSIVVTEEKVSKRVLKKRANSLDIVAAFFDQIPDVLDPVEGAPACAAQPKLNFDFTKFTRPKLNLMPNDSGSQFDGYARREEPVAKAEKLLDASYELVAVPESEE